MNNEKNQYLDKIAIVNLLRSKAKVKIVGYNKRRKNKLCALLLEDTEEIEGINLKKGDHFLFSENSIDTIEA